jgi:hypothetical protein
MSVFDDFVNDNDVPSDKNSNKKSRLTRREIQRRTISYSLKTMRDGTNPVLADAYDACLADVYELRAGGMKAWGDAAGHGSGGLGLHRSGDEIVACRENVALYLKPFPLEAGEIAAECGFTSVDEMVTWAATLPSAVG